jgi:predicted HAD superfamily Cof-like phosphohydrolase
MTLVAEFHEAFGTTDPQVPTPPNRARAALRLRLIEEEFKEVRFELRALMLSDEVGTPISDRLTIMARLLKELCDLQYVLQGTADSLGLGAVFEQAYHEVHRSNMSKLDADGKPIKRESDGKVLKGPLYYPPDMEQFINIFNHEE